MVTEKQFKVLVAEELDKLKAIGLVIPDGPPVEFKLSKRLKKRTYGTYKELRSRPFLNLHSDAVVIKRKITVSAYLPPDITRQTLMHELLHAVAGAAAGHGYHWKKLVKKVNTVYGYEITTRVTPIAKNVTNEYRKQLNLI